MDFVKSLGDLSRREVMKETGLIVGEPRLLGVFSGPHCYFKVSNGDELYSATEVCISRDIRSGS